MNRKKIGKAISVFTALLAVLLAAALFSDSVVHSVLGVSVIGALAFLCGFFLLKALFLFAEESERSLHGLLKVGYVLCFLLTIAMLSIICVGEGPSRNSGFLVSVFSFTAGMLAHEISQTNIHGKGWV